MYGSDHLFLLSRFIKGLQVAPAALSDELKQSIGLEPMSKGIRYMIYTKVHAYTTHRQLLCGSVHLSVYFKQRLNISVTFCDQLTVEGCDMSIVRLQDKFTFMSPFPFTCFYVTLCCSTSAEYCSTSCKIQKFL